MRYLQLTHNEWDPARKASRTKQRGELVPDRFDDRGWQRRHKHLGEDGWRRQPATYQGLCLHLLTDTPPIGATS